MSGFTKLIMIRSALRFFQDTDAFSKFREIVSIFLGLRKALQLHDEKLVLLAKNSVPKANI